MHSSSTTKTRRTGIAMGVSVAVVLASGVVLAAVSNTWTLPGSACFTYMPGDGNGTATNGVYVHQGGKVRNANTDGSVVDVTCPVLRGNTTNTTGLSAAKAYVYRPTANATVINCTLYSIKNLNSGYVIVSNSQSISGSGTGDLTLDFGANVNSSINGTNSFYSMFCDLPKQGDILYGYTWTEP